VGKIRHLTGTRAPTPRSSSPQPVAIRTKLSRFLKKVYKDEKNFNSGAFLLFLIDRPGFRDKPQRPGLHRLNQDVVSAGFKTLVLPTLSERPRKISGADINGTDQFLIYDGVNLVGEEGLTP
jgi:hypothetical protein